MSNQVDFSTLAVSSTAVNLADSASPTLPARAKGCIITIETDQVRWRADGTVPTASQGHLLDVYDTFVLDSWSHGRDWRSFMKAIYFIRVTNDAALKITWFD